MGGGGAVGQGSTIRQAQLAAATAQRQQYMVLCMQVGGGVGGDTYASSGTACCTEAHAWWQGHNSIACTSIALLWHQRICHWDILHSKPSGNALQVLAHNFNWLMLVTQRLQVILPTHKGCG